MTLTRTWRPPPPGGSTIELINDTHIVGPGSGLTREQAYYRDVPNLTLGITRVIARVHAGDIIHNMGSTDFATQKPYGLDYLDALRDSAPLMYTIGNHELNNGHTGDSVATAFGNTARCYTAEHGPFKFIMYGAANSAETGSSEAGTTGDWVIPADTLTWIDTEMGNTTKPTIFVSHCPLQGHFSDLQGYYLTPNATISTILASHPNVVAHMCGHRHMWFDNDNVVKLATYGTNNICLMTGGISGGTLADDAHLTDHPVETDTPVGSCYATYFDATDPGGERWEVRWRDHSIGMWGTVETWPAYMKTIYL